MIMRATEKKLRDRHTRLPEQYKKVDTTVNGDAENLIEERRQLEKNLVPLRLSNTTVIYVTRISKTKRMQQWRVNEWE